MKNALILHGTSASHVDHWFPWLKKQLEIVGFQVWVPDLPNANVPDIKTYNQFLKNHYGQSFAGKDGFVCTDESIIVGHSSGAVEILGFLNDPNCPFQGKLKACFLVGAFQGDLGREQLKGMVEKFDFDLIKSRCASFVLIHSPDDPICPIADARALSAKLDGTCIEIPNKGHFITDTDPTLVAVPEILSIIECELQDKQLRAKAFE